MSSGPDSPPRLDRINQCLWQGKQRTDLSSNAFRMLVYLLERRHQLVSKNELLDALWPGAHVVDAVLSVTISQLREALGDDPRQPRFIETLHRRGYRWIGDLAPETASLHATTEPRGPTLVGRDTALAQLEAAATHAASGRRQIVFVTGEPGIGKTALVDHFLASSTTRHRLIGRGQCIDGYGTSEMYLPILEALQQMVNTSGDAIALLRRHAPTWLLQLPGLLTPAEQDELRRSLAASTGARMVRELQHALETLAADRLVVLVIEDLHWSDPATVSALGGLAMRREPSQLLVVATYRPVDAVAGLHPITQLKHELTARRQCLEIALDGFEVDAVSDYLAARFVRNTFPSDVAARLHVQTAGNPLFLLNALEDLEQRRWLTCADGVWRCAVDTERLDGAVPDSTRAMIESRLARLPPSTAALLEAASVIGPSFASQTLAAAVDRDAELVELDCTALARADRFVSESEPAHWPDGSSGAQYMFRHALYRQVLHGRVTPARRQSLERAIAERLERGFGDSDEVAGLLAGHWERGGDLDRAVTCHARSAGIARARFSYEQAAAQYRHALELLQRLPANAARDARELRLQADRLTTLGTVVSASGLGSAELQDIAARIDSLSCVAETTPTLLGALSNLVGFLVSLGELGRAEVLSERALDRAAAVDWGMIFADVARGFLGFTHLFCGRLASALPNLSVGAALPPLGAVAALEPSILFEGDLGLAYALSGDLRHGREAILHADARAAAAGHPPTIVQASLNTMLLGQMIGDGALIERVANTMGEMADRLAQPRLDACRLICIGWLGMQAGRPDGIATFQEATERMAADGHVLNTQFPTCQAAAGLLRLGRLEDARSTLAEAFELLETTGARWCESELLRVRGQIAAAAAQALSRRSKERAELLAEAERCFRHATDVARAQGARWWELHAWFDLAKLTESTDTAEELRRLHAAIDDGSDAGALREVRTFLS